MSLPSNEPSAAAAIARSKLARLGRISQLAYVPDDFERSLRHWTEVMGAGPFLRIDHVKTTDGMYRGHPADIDFAAAVGFWGDMQIELIRQHSDVPSIYRDWKNAPDGDRLHHTCLTVDDLAQASEAARLGGLSIVQGGTLVGGTRFVYADLGDGAPAQYLEIAQVAQATREMMGWLLAASRDWDGRDPIRTPGA
ncbi:VOC family protein [Variovorax sp. PDNC026]|uniref:VOC family protein n=1 Tax=Variovorax sp. PDNC026 TaxID=2811425 RepID=UPI001963B798|nr:VOC family protein [Variovorax sp. PDNC026]QRY31840.1 VOC family protein [Variovorax sp. PDNC026]